MIRKSVSKWIYYTIEASRSSAGEWDSGHGQLVGFISTYKRKEVIQKGIGQWIHC